MRVLLKEMGLPYNLFSRRLINSHNTIDTFRWRVCIDYRSPGNKNRPNDCCYLLNWTLCRCYLRNNSNAGDINEIFIWASRHLRLVSASTLTSTLHPRMKPVVLSGLLFAVVLCAFSRGHRTTTTTTTTTTTAPPTTDPPTTVPAKCRDLFAICTDPDCADYAIQKPDDCSVAIKSYGVLCKRCINTTTIW